MRTSVALWAACLLAGGRAGHGQAPFRKPDLTVQAFIMKDTGNPQKPENVRSFLIGETGVFAFGVLLSETVEYASTRMVGNWELIGPDGFSLPVGETILRPEGPHINNPRLIVMRPFAEWTFKLCDPTGGYTIRMAVTDEVSKATATLEGTLPIHLTEAVRKRIPTPPPKTPVALDGILLEDGFWKMPLTDFAVRVWTAGFGWSAGGRAGLRSVARQATFFGQTIDEAIVGFKEDRPGNVSMVLYSRIRSGPVDNADFTNRITQVVEGLRKATGLMPQKATPSADAVAAAKARPQALVWKRERDTILMEYGWSYGNPQPGRPRAMEPEFFHLAIAPRTNAASAKPSPR